MSDTESILDLWRRLTGAGIDYVLATLLSVEGSSYRRPGALMLLAADGRRAGTISGGCLEAVVARRAWWLTANGPVIERFSTVEEDGERPYGSGCGGVLQLLLEPSGTAQQVLAALDKSHRLRVPLATATVLNGPLLLQRTFAGIHPIGELEKDPLARESKELQALADSALDLKVTSTQSITLGQVTRQAWVSYHPSRAGLWIFGAGDDAVPVVAMAKQMGWYCCVADGRSNLAAQSRFPLADEVHAMDRESLRSNPLESTPPAFKNLKPGDAAVVMTHSFEQDSLILSTLLALDESPAYIGVLGPQRRTRELLQEVTRIHCPNCDEAGIHHKMAGPWMSRIHFPMGLDLGGDSPAAVALSVIAEIHKSLHGASGRPLQEVRSVPAKEKSVEWIKETEK